MAVQRWVAYDPALSSSYEFVYNPQRSNTPAYEKQFTYTSTAAPGGKTLVFEGQDQPRRLEFSGALYSQAELDAFVTWWDKRNQVRITDDLNRQFWVIIESLKLQREPKIHYPYRHTYDISAVLVDYP